MVINTTRWSPDTCGCELEYSWNTNENENSRRHDFARIVKVCSAHNGIVPPQTTNPGLLKRIYDAVIEENTRKNQALSVSLETNPELTDIVDSRTGKRYDLMTIAKQMKVEANPAKVAADLNAGTVLKEGINYTWRWVEEKAKAGQPRTLEIDFETTASLEDVIAAKAQNPTATQEQVQQQTRKRLMGDTPDALQQALDSKFTKEKGRGQVKVKRE